MLPNSDFLLLRQKDLHDALAPKRSFHGAVFVLRDLFHALQGCHFAYEFMLQHSAFIRGDIINATTLPRVTGDLYIASVGGKTAMDIADALTVTQRTVELRLQSLRKKLRARTTTEAVYKAICYGIL